MALDTRGLAAGFTQGFGLADNYYRGQKQDDRAERGLQMREESFEMQKEQAEQQQNQETAKFVFGKIANNMDLADEEMQWLKENPNYLAALNPETDKAIDVAQRVIDPNDPLDLNDDEALYALNTTFEPMINRGKGGRKRIAAGLPGQQEGTLAFELDVEREDGRKERAPMTRNRGVAGEDDEILQVPVGDMVDTMQGYRMLRNVINTNGASQNAAKLYSMLTGTQPEREESWSEPFEMNGGQYQRSGLTGEIREVQSPSSARNGQGGGADLSPQQEVYAKRLQSEVDHLWRMERQIQTGQSDGMSIFLGGMEETVTPDNKDQLLSDIRQRIQSNEQELNKLMGASAPQSGNETILEQAEQIPPEQREQELADLKSNPQVPYMVIRQIEEMWGMGGNAQPQGRQQQTRQPSQQQRPQQQPSGSEQPGLQQPEPQREPERQTGLQPAANERPGPNPRPDQPMGLQDPGQIGINPGGQNEAQSLQDQIVQRSREEGQQNAQASARQARQEVRGAIESNRFSQMDKNQRQAFLNRYGQYFKSMPESDIARLKEVFDDSAINQFLQ